VPVVLATEPWTGPLKDERFQRGPHKSAEEHIEFLQEEYLDFCQKGFWMLLPYDQVRDLPGLRLSPLGVVPQRDRRPRVIVDYSYYGINKETVKLSPLESMQFGKANERLWQTMGRAHPKFGRMHMYKIDISDGFYRVPLSNSGVQWLGVCLPRFRASPDWSPSPLFSRWGGLSPHRTSVLPQRPPATLPTIPFKPMPDTQSILSKPELALATVVPTQTQDLTLCPSARSPNPTDAV
jgi:hypothetical protein